MNGIWRYYGAVIDMAYITINGITVKVRIGSATLSPKLIGATSRSIGGSLLRDVRAQKREWRFRTPVLSQAEAEALIGLINGRGQHFGFEDTAVADSGLTPSSGTTGAVYYGDTAADGKQQVLNDTAESLYAAGTKSIWCGEAATNLLSNDEADCENAVVAHTATGSAALARNATHYWEQTHSLEIDCSGGAGGAQTGSTGAASVSPSDEVTFGVWVNGAAGGESVQLKINWRDSGDSSLSTSTSSTFTINDSSLWEFVHFTATAPASTDRIRVEVSVGNTETVYADGWQAAVAGVPTPWVGGGSSLSAVAPSYTNPLPQGSKALTIAAWINGSASASAGAALGVILDQRVDSDNRLALYINNTTETLRFAYVAGGVSTLLTSTTPVAFGDIWHVAVTVDLATSAQKLYVNSTEEDSDTFSGTAWDLDDVATFLVGNITGSGNPLNGFVDQLIVAPYVMTATQIANLYNSATAQSVGIPKLICAGDFTPESSVECLGRVDRLRNIPLTLGGTWANNAMEVEFSLLEV